MFNDLAPGERHSISEITVFVDPMPFDCTKEKTKLCTDLVRENMYALHRCGAPHDYFNMNDLPRLEREYKMYVF